MSGGSGVKSESQNAAASPAARVDYPNAPFQTAFPQAMPGQLEAIAAQLSAGFGGTHAAAMQQLDDIYRPMSVMQIKEPMSVTEERFKANPGAYNPVVSGNPVVDEIVMGKPAGSILSSNPSAAALPAAPASQPVAAPAPSGIDQWRAAQGVQNVPPGGYRDQFDWRQEEQPAVDITKMTPTQMAALFREQRGSR